MKNIKTYLILLLTSSTSVSYGVTLPSHSFFGANEMYEENHDQIEYSIGTQIRNINMIISGDFDEWGNHCLAVSGGEQGRCQDCCDEQWAAVDYNFSDEFEKKYDNCFSICGGGPSLPLGSTLWMLPFVFAYAGVKKYRKAQMNITQVL